MITCAAVDLTILEQPDNPRGGQPQCNDIADSLNGRCRHKFLKYPSCSAMGRNVDPVVEHISDKLLLDTDSPGHIPMASIHGLSLGYDVDLPFIFPPNQSAVDFGIRMIE